MGRRRTRLTRGTSESTYFPFNPHSLSYRIIEGLKQDCMRENGNKDFWTEVQKLGLGRSMNLTEAKRLGYMDVSDSAAESVSASCFIF